MKWVWSHSWVGPTSVRDIVAVEWHHVSHHVSVAMVIPGLPPHELQPLALGQLLLDGVVYPLQQHARQAHSLQQVCHGRGVAKWIDGPPSFQSHT